MDKRFTGTKQYSSIVLRITAIFLIAIISVSPVWARSSTEIGQDIINKQREIEENERRLAESAANRQRYEADAASLQEGVPQLEAQIKQLEEELNGIKLEISILEQEQTLKELERERTQFNQNQTIKGSYMDWKSTSHDVRMFVDEDVEFNRIQQYQSAIAGNNKVTIDNLTGELIKIDGQMSVLSQKKADLEVKEAEVQEQKRQLEERLAQLRWGISYEAGNLNNLQNSVKQAQSDITFLTGEQSAALQREAELALLQGDNPSIGGCLTTDTANSGNISFCGLGRDARQGHGVGMSQWGAYGYGANGFLYTQILQIYYSNTVLSSGYENSTVTVDGYGAVNIENYVAGQGEVPGRACGNSAQVAARPDKYVLDNTNTPWDCWPEETIKAQAIAFRTYGLYHGWLYNDARSQVYNGSQFTRWAADETRGQVLTSGGTIIESLYSSDNSQGFGTANNDTIFQNYYGDGYPSSYLRAVNDTAYASTTAWTYWGYQSSTYNLNRIIEMLNYIKTNPSSYYWIDPSLMNFASSAVNTLGGNISSISFERDSSRRVKKVILNGAHGTVYIGGYWFKYMWNEWVGYYDIRNAGQTDRIDYLYSQTFFIH